MAAASRGASPWAMASAPAVTIEGIAASSTVTRAIDPCRFSTGTSSNASAGITASFSTSPAASGLSSSRGRAKRTDRPMVSIASGSRASDSRCSPPSIHAGGSAGITVKPASSAHSGGNFATRSAISRAEGACSPP